MNIADFVKTARSFIGTPFAHQGRLPGVGLDCAGVVVMAAIENGLQIEDEFGYPEISEDNVFADKVASYCDIIPISECAAGDLMMFRFFKNPQHIAIVSNINPLMIIHGYMQVGKTVENNVDATWLKRLTGCYRIKND